MGVEPALALYFLLPPYLLLIFPPSPCPSLSPSPSASLSLCPNPSCTVFASGMATRGRLQGSRHQWIPYDVAVWKEGRILAPVALEDRRHHHHPSSLSEGKLDALSPPRFAQQHADWCMLAS